MLRRKGRAALWLAFCAACSFVPAPRPLGRDDLDALVARLAANEQTPFEREPEVRSVARALLRDAVQGAPPDVPAAAIAAQHEARVALGLWPADAEPQGPSLIVENALALYVPWHHTVFLVDDAPLPGHVRFAALLAGQDLAREAALARELARVLQHERHPDFFATDPFWLGQGDAALALRAALEGDATRAAFEVLGVEQPPSREDLLERADQLLASDALARRMPALVQMEWIFPYAYGYPLARAEGRELLRDPPASTEQVLHEDARRASFQAFDLRALELPAGCARVQEGTVGELGLSVLFRELAEAAPAEVWRGWDGDRYLAARCAGRVELAWLAAFDRPRDAYEFQLAYAQIAARIATRAGHALPPLAIRRGDEVAITTLGLAPLAPRLAGAARRARVTTLAELRAHFGATD